MWTWILLLTPMSAVTGAGTKVPASAAESAIAEGAAAASQQQVRIDQRGVIRIAPRAGGQLRRLPADGRPYRERDIARCLPLAAIVGAGVELPDRVLLFLRDRRLIGARLEKSCRAHDYYSGFYIEPSADGRLCAGRDLLLARSGARCSVSALRELSPSGR